ncbi:CBS domain-containing protein [Plastoroseomonas hellenica]|uniref:CBS domain-containing protein n=1 Tax=Plastoroseomonas hellenica TaxID=2687306 RepID=A0ABS5F696_9PROT|nr:CBS domain-containing protein [Plastoroseomonas hellenica]MBR0645315.1 CBS domain-containing protein [Plastoroseomonas hellenica]MBR0667650.1 CBS domain-containing protein [Plastoroseomonas hellenica]
MNIGHCMSRDVQIASPSQTIQTAARMMKEIDAGMLPVGENDRLIGMITDRDIAVRAVASGRGPDTSVREIMSTEVHYCFDDEDLDTVSLYMGEQQLRRLPVLNRDKRLVGIVALSDISLADDDGFASANALSGVSQPGGRHVQR